MPKFRIETRLADDMAQAPPYEITVADSDAGIDGLLSAVADELVNDAGKLVSSGITVTITGAD